MARGVRSAHVISLRPLHSHVSSAILAVPARSLRHRVPVGTFPAELFHLADPTHSTGYEPKGFDKINSADGDPTPINDPNYDNISNFSKIPRENTGLFGVPTMSEASESHVSHGEFPPQGESKDSMHLETVTGQRETRKIRFCDQCCRVDVKEKSTEQY